ncbi:NUDIX domain-containing protein [Candidatus Pacearchaeota archaeon]|nr:NUDIX domain-containing protein [Candidatus Pacearchaeota archaeon]
MVREILVVKKETLFGEESFQGFIPDSQRNFIDTIHNSFEYKERDSVEEDTSFRQPIPYVFIINKNDKKVFAYRRASKGYSEKRLRNNWSCGLGGHIDKSDSENPVMTAMMRELDEEVVSSHALTPTIIGYLNDETNDVGKVHFGVIAIAETEGTVEKGSDEMAEGRFISIEEMESLLSDPSSEVENWTKIAWPYVKEYMLNLSIV